MLDQLLALDQALFLLINGDWHPNWLDAVMPYWRDKKTWIPLYVLLAGFLGYRFRWRGLYLILAVALTVGVADTISSKVVKKSVKRLRPCNEPALQTEVNIVDGCGGGYSFTSSHATNHFAVAVVLLLTLGRRYRWATWPLLLWAASIAFGQVYVGVHYPLDVLCGALLGSVIGWGIAMLYPERWAFWHGAT